MHTDVTTIEKEIRDALLISARQYVDERARNRVSRTRLTWAFGRACITAGGWLLSTVLLCPKGHGTAPAIRCLSEYGELARKHVDGENL